MDVTAILVCSTTAVFREPVRINDPGYLSTRWRSALGPSVISTSYLGDPRRNADHHDPATFDTEQGETNDLTNQPVLAGKVETRPPGRPDAKVTG